MIPFPPVVKPNPLRDTFVPPLGRFSELFTRTNDSRASFTVLLPKVLVSPRIQA